jgi:hypothetical protein
MTRRTMFAKMAAAPLAMLAAPGPKVQPATLTVNDAARPVPSPALVEAYMAALRTIEMQRQAIEDMQYCSPQAIANNLAMLGV